MPDTVVAQPKTETPSPQPSLPDRPGQRRPAERSAARWVIDVLMILLSVAVGFAAAQYGEYRTNRGFKATVERSVRAEVERNLAVLEPMLAKHREWEAALKKVDTDRDRRPAYEILLDLRPNGGVSIGVPLEQAAWNTAVSSGVLKL